MPHQDDMGTLLFSDWLAQHKGGHLDNELTALLREVATGARIHTKPGSIRLDIKLTPRTDHHVPVVEVRDIISAKVPEADRTQALYFTNDHGELVKNDPTQEALPFTRTEDPTP